MSELKTALSYVSSFLKIRHEVENEEFLIEDIYDHVIRKCWYSKEFKDAIYKISEFFESPIEEMFFFAIMYCLQVDPCTIILQRDEISASTGKYVSPPSISNFIVTLQRKFGKYKSDFEIIYWMSTEEDFEKKTAKLIVECDGHEFHEKTKEQAKRDKTRDRAFQTAGYRVYRFTGSEIWSDPFGCANEVVNAMYAKMRLDNKVYMQFLEKERQKRRKAKTE